MAQQKIGIEQILPYALMICIAIVGISIMASIISSVSDNALTWSGTSTITANYGTAESLNHAYLTALSSVTCAGNTLVANTDYTSDLDAGTVTIQSYPNAVVLDNATLLNDTNVSFSAGNWADATAFVLINCTDNTTILAGNYSFYSTNATVYVNSSVGGMLNNTEYCANYTYAMINDGGSCSVGYTYAGEGKQIAEQGLTAFGQFGSWWSVIIVIVIAVIIIGLVVRMTKGRGN